MKHLLAHLDEHTALAHARTAEVTALRTVDGVFLAQRATRAHSEEAREGGQGDEVRQETKGQVTGGRVWMAPACGIFLACELFGYFGEREAWAAAAMHVEGSY